MNFSVIKSEHIYIGKVFDLKVDTILYENGNEGVRQVAIHPGGAVIVPLDKENRALVVTQYRYPLGKRIMEFPAGKLNPDEDPAVCAARELAEETGYTPASLIKLGAICTTPGFCDEILHIYLARDLQPGNTAREDGEHDMEMEFFTMEKIESLIASGTFFDAKSLSALYMTKIFLANESLC